VGAGACPTPITVEANPGRGLADGSGATRNSGQVLREWREITWASVPPTSRPVPSLSSLPVLAAWLDGSEDIRLGGAFGESSAGKAETREADQKQQESDHGGEDACPTVEPDDGIEQVLPVLLQGFDGDDWTQATPLPGREGGAWDGDMPRKESGAGADDMLAQAVVIGAPPARGGRGDGEHRGRIAQPGSACRKPE